jgi:curved DNA-binding protein
MDYRDYYTLLGVAKTATDKEIRSAYRKLARKHHPDVNPGNDAAEARFKQINEANEVLSDPDKRALYDALGPRWKEYDQYRAAGGTASPAEFARATADPAQAQGTPRPSARTARPRAQTSADDLRDLFGQENPHSDFFESLFGQAGGPGRPVNGADAQVEVSVSLEEAFHGTTRQLQFTDPSGGTRAIEARIPRGVRDGSSIRLRGQGGPGQQGGAAGDLYLVVAVREHGRFRRDGDDLRLEESVPIFICMLGGEILVDTLQGSRLAVRVPPETQNGKAIRLKGKGMPHLRHPESAGDLYVVVRVELPMHLSQEERELFAKLAAGRGAMRTGGHC